LTNLFGIHSGDHVRIKATGQIGVVVRAHYDCWDIKGSKFEIIVLDPDGKRWYNKNEFEVTAATG